MNRISSDGGPPAAGAEASGGAPPWNAQPQAQGRSGSKTGRDAAAHGSGDEPVALQKIFVGGVPQEMSKDDFYSFFDSIARVKRAWLQKCYTSKAQRSLPHRGFGFVIFQEAEAVERLLPLRGGAGCHWDKENILCRYLMTPEGRRLEIKRATPSSKKSVGAAGGPGTAPGGSMVVPSSLPPFQSRPPQQQLPLHLPNLHQHQWQAQGQLEQQSGALPFMWNQQPQQSLPYPGPQQHAHHGSQPYHGPHPPHMLMPMAGAEMSGSGVMCKTVMSPQMAQMVPSMQDHSSAAQGIIPMGMWAHPSNSAPQPYYNDNVSQQCGMMPATQGVMQVPMPPPLPQGMQGYGFGMSPMQGQPPR